MTDTIAIIGIIAGSIILICGKKKGNSNIFKLIGRLVILISLGIVAPDFIEGFKEGFKNAIASL
ncbi:hypothetical protein [Clostridium sp. JS66]|uniref:hypothetical protein n=1 Tax=Clostridium sp. JS66 TaxID=3064705 RepID=UPI00298DA5D2|nr:hypothetical protein [Clostridium sp. JS66]WPC39767.1 hypothetical protein Q6H37_17825 [Clostridium sp. JS66]